MDYTDSIIRRIFLYFIILCIKIIHKDIKITLGVIKYMVRDNHARYGGKMNTFSNNEDDWKTKDNKYLKEVQKMFDIVENVEDEDLKRRIIIQYLKCDSLITELAKKMIKQE